MFWGRVEKTFGGCGDVIWHGNVDTPLVVIQVNDKSTVVIPLKVHEYFVILFKSVQDMISAGIGKVFYTRIINAEANFSPLC